MKKRVFRKNFDEIVEQLQVLSTPELEEEISLTPVMKEAGTMDQGYRHD